MESTIDESISNWPTSTYTSFSDISFSIPQRKKLKLEIGNGVRAKNANDDIEAFVSFPLVDDIVCLPVPEKAQAQYNFCVFADLIDYNSGPAAVEQILWTVSEVPSKANPNLPTKAGVMEKLQEHQMKVVEPSKEEFSSQLQQAVRKGETAYHVRAFRGAKEGYLFFLSTGIFWGFKKPIEFYAFRIINSVSYTSILQRTFNLVVSTKKSMDSPVLEHEFSMIDQVDFAGIEAYVKRHELQDASMAEQRRAKKVNVNGIKKGEQKGDGEDEEGELQKAQREIEQQGEDDDDDEEDDENFDPGSEGESEGEGSSSADDEAAGDRHADNDDEEMYEEDEEDDD